MTTGGRSGAEGAGIRHGLDKAAVLDAAVRLIDARGTAGFSVRELARVMGVYPATIYWHIGGRKDDFLAEVAAHVIDGFMVPAPKGEDWRVTLRGLFEGYRKAMHRHPNIATFTGSQLVSNGMSSAPLIERILDALGRAGFEGTALIDAYNATLAALVGFVTLELAAAPARQQEWEDRFREDLAQIDAERFPRLHSALPDMANKAFILRWDNGSVVPLDGGFRVYVEAFIAGLASRTKG
ncbi:TetR/AcrR family transcriptional regulator [Halodurantibacterium flavum]|uniref:TetR/AcrR family transcriptional regulator n=1 Tax=Halodurantibacterium flavum TaxID=1382802 RepID=A0ABW4S2K1_9RHOB